MKRKQIVSLLLALLLFFSCLPFPVQAEEMNADSGTGDDSVDAFYDANEASFDEELLNDDWWKAYVDDDSTEDEADGTWDELSKEDESDDQETAEDPAWHDNGEQDDSSQNGDEDRNESLPDSEPDESKPALTLEEAIEQHGYAYVLTNRETEVYPFCQWKQHLLGMNIF